MEGGPITYLNMQLFGKKLPILNLNSTLVLLDLLPESKAIRCKWDFKKKLKLGGKIYKYKARPSE